MAARAHYAVGVDAGSNRTRCVIYLLEDLHLRFLSYGDVPSVGWAKGRIVDVDAASQAIAEAVQKAETGAGALVESAVVGVGGATVCGDDCRGIYEFRRPRELVVSDLEYAVQLASRVRLEDDRLVVHVFPQDFTLDGRAGSRYPRGATCSRLEANVHVVTTSAQDHNCLVSAMHEARLKVEETVFEGVAAAYAAILPEDRNRGVALVDIGLHSTEIVIYEGDALVHSASLPVSGDHFTRDVAWGLCVSYEDAENLKREYGCAILGLTSDNSLIEVPSPEGRQPKEAPRRQLNEILEARAEELFVYVEREFVKAGMEKSLGDGVVLTGGGSLLNGMCDMAERVLNCQARNGLPVGVENWPVDLLDSSWATTAGLTMYSARLKLLKDNKRRAPGFLGLVLR